MSDKLSKKQQRILFALSSGREMYGLELVAAGVATRLFLYVTLGHMEDRGLIEGREDSYVAAPRRLYRITDQGRAALKRATGIV